MSCFKSFQSLCQKVDDIWNYRVDALNRMKLSIHQGTLAIYVANSSFKKNLSLISWEHPTNCGMRRQHFFITLNNKTAFRSRKRICCSWELLSIFLESFYGTFRNEWCLEIRMQQKGPLIYIMSQKSKASVKITPDRNCFADLFGAFVTSWI